MYPTNTITSDTLQMLACVNLCWIEVLPACPCIAVRCREELSQALALHTIKGHEHHIQACCALTGEGLPAGMDWVSQRTKAAAGQTAKEQP